MTVRRPAAGDVSGQIMLLSIAYGVLALLLVTTIVSASSVHLERKRLLALADLTALAAVDALAEEEYYGRDPGSAEILPITPSSCRAAAQQHLAESPESDSFTGLALAEADTPRLRARRCRAAPDAQPGRRDCRHSHVLTVEELEQRCRGRRS